jgi:putative membrane protein insertion efficiency factor
MLKKVIKQPFIFLIKIYQIFISPFLGAGKCCYYPTCSNYFIMAIEKRGLLKGLLLGVWRILKCHPYSKGGFDPVK